MVYFYTNPQQAHDVPPEDGIEDGLVEIDEIDDVEFDDEGHPYIVYTKIQPLAENAAIMTYIMQGSIQATAAPPQQILIDARTDSDIGMPLYGNGYTPEQQYINNDKEDAVTIVTHSDIGLPVYVPRVPPEQHQNISDAITMNINDHLEHRSLRVGVKCDFKSKESDCMSFSADSGIGASTLYEEACEWIPSVPFMLSHGAKGSLHYKQVPRHGSIGVPTAGKTRLHFNMHGVVLGGMPKRDASEAELDDNATFVDLFFVETVAPSSGRSIRIMRFLIFLVMQQVLRGKSSNPLMLPKIWPSLRL